MDKRSTAFWVLCTLPVIQAYAQPAIESTVLNFKKFPQGATLAFCFVGWAPLGAQPITITTNESDLGSATVGTSYSHNFTVANCGTGCLWSSVGNPYNLFMGSTGVLSGTVEVCSNFWSGNGPCSTAACNYTFNPMVCPFTVQVSGSNGTASQTFALPINWAPSYSTYIVGQYQNFNLMSQSAGLSPPPIVGGGHLVIANPFFRNSSYDNLAAWNAWVDAMKAAGMRIVNIEVDLECLLSVRTSCLSLYAGAIYHAHQLGMTVSVNPAYYTTAANNTIPSCGDAGCPGGGNGITGTVGGIAGACANVLTYAINAGPKVGTTYGSGVNDWYTCLIAYAVPGLGTPSGMSAYQYILQVWLKPGDRFVPVHEPTTQAAQWNEFTDNPSNTADSCVFGGSGFSATQYCSGQSSGSTAKNNRTCPQDWLDNFLTPFFNTNLPSWSGVSAGIGYGVTVNVPEMETGSASTGGYYATAFSNNLNSTVAMGLDMYDFSPPRQSLYTQTIQTFRGIPSGTAHSYFVEEYGPQAWTYTNGPGGEACAIVGLQSCTWNSFNQDFVASLLPFLSSQGVTDASLYGTEVIGACAPVYPDNPQASDAVLNTATIAMENRQYSLASARLSLILSQWGTTSIQGCTLAGKTELQ